jgi:hypothetical protein
MGECLLAAMRNAFRTGETECTDEERKRQELKMVVFARPGRHSSWGIRHGDMAERGVHIANEWAIQDAFRAGVSDALLVEVGRRYREIAQPCEQVRSRQ